MPPPSDVSIQKLPPQNIEAEQAVLAGILLDNPALNRVLEVMDPTDFYKENHRKIFRAMLSLSEANEGIDLISLPERLQRDGCLEGIGGVSYLTDVMNSVATAAHVHYHAKIVHEKAVLRQLIHVATDIVTQGFTDQSPDVGSLLDHAEKAIFGISEKRTRATFVPMKTLVKQSFEVIEKLSEREITGLSTGFADLDKLTAGLHPSDLVIVAGRPSMGKTAFALGIAQHAAIADARGVGIFSLEMAKEQLGVRMLCAEARVDAQRIRSGHAGKLKSEHWKQLIRAAGKLSEAPIFIDDSGAITLLEMRAKARRLKAEQDIGLIIVDYLQLVQGGGGGEKSESRQQEISDISRGLKALAKELSVPVIALSQLSRAVEQRPEKKKRPILADLRESGAIEQDADLVLFIYREEVYDPCICPREGDCICGKRKGTAEIIIGKQRNGPIGSVMLAFLDRYTRFEDLAPDHPSRYQQGGFV